MKRKAKRQQRLLDERLQDLQRLEELDGEPVGQGQTRALWRLQEDEEEAEAEAYAPGETRRSEVRQARLRKEPLGKGLCVFIYIYLFVCFLTCR